MTAVHHCYSSLSYQTAYNYLLGALKFTHLIDLPAAQMLKVINFGAFLYYHINYYD